MAQHVQQGYLIFSSRNFNAILINAWQYLDNLTLLSGHCNLNELINCIRYATSYLNTTIRGSAGVQSPGPQCPCQWPCWFNYWSRIRHLCREAVHLEPLIQCQYQSVACIVTIIQQNMRKCGPYLHHLYRQTFSGYDIDTNSRFS